MDFMISKEETEHIAKLARLGLSDEEIAKYQRDLSSILDYVEKLKEVNIEGVEPFTHPLAISNVARADIARKKSAEQVKKLTEAMPETKGGFLKVKSVFE